jgi:hypothetical protein
MDMVGLGPGYLSQLCLRIRPLCLVRVRAQSTHRVAMATFWGKFHHDGEISQPGEGGGARPPFFTLQYLYHHVQSCGVRSSCVGRYTPPISTLPLYARKCQLPLCVYSVII